MKGSSECLHPDGCQRPIRAQGLCNAHYKRIRRTGDIGPAEVQRRVPGDVCQMLDCDEPHKGRGYCYKHLTRVQRHGDPDCVETAPGSSAGPDNPNWRAENIGYGGAHERVRRERGSADRYLCIDCDNHALEWAYDHADPDEMFSERTGYPYSSNPAHYRPMCRSCHRQFDQLQLLATPWGHKVATALNGDES